ncbi:DUF4132 domain-containing protein [Glycomyces harbinensis]|uniref:DUF4132 domain-containing protein n=1 Tax=Glycomyces harbinensis TaxID=58114 RepID=A0A1G6WJI4_9ACTN|nr:DUF4132 domain-containing protein [Glycomyces harbinensis]SDD66120.1 protein of unknown function [Glycomyces harbinensis]
MTDTVAPREDRLVVPEAWLDGLLPFRGRRTGPPVELDPDAPERLRGLAKAHDADLRAALAQPDNQDFAAAGLRHLDGGLDAYGAGVVAVLLRGSDRHKSPSMLRPELDAWVLEHGLAFALTASLAALQVNPWNLYQRGKAIDIAQRKLAVVRLGHVGALFHEVQQGVKALRGLIAAADEAEYAAVVAAAAAFRTGPTERFLVGLLLPEQREWVDEVCREYKDLDGYYTDKILWEFVSTSEQLTAAGLSKLERWEAGTHLTGTLLHNLGAASLPVFTATLRQQVDGDGRANLLEAVGLIPGDEPMSYLVGNLAEPGVYRAAASAAARFPRRALRAIAAADAALAPELRPRLASLAALVPEAVRAAHPDRAAIEALLACSSVPEAAVDDLPTLLTSPPWTKKRPKTKPVVLDGLAAPDGIAVTWAEGERERWSVPEANYFRNHTEDDWHHSIRRAGKHHDGRMYAIALAYAPLAIAAEALEKWDGAFAPYTSSDINVVLSRFEADVAQRILVHLRKNAADHRALVPILSLDAARLAADWFDRLKSARASAVAWFDRHGTEGARMLVPDALGADKRARRVAEGALAFIAARQGDAVVEAAAASYGDDAAAAIRDLLDGDPLEPRGVKLPKPGAWADPAMLPQVLAGDRALPAESVRHLITVLALTTPEYPYAGLDVVAEACDRASLARFSRALFQVWLAEGGPSKDGWALTQLAHFADDDTVRLLAPKIREWPGLSQHKRAVNGLGVLGAIGTEEALRAIQGIAEKVKFKALKQEAGVQIETIAAELGLSRDQLADRLVPGFGLGDEALVLDYGPRKFTVVFDEQLKPYVTDEDGKPRKSLPKPGAKDDAAVADAAYQRFSLLKKELRTAASDQVSRLEAAMVNARTWNADEFRRFFAEHPLVKHLARRLVWLAEADGARTGFRIAEDGSYSDAADDAFTLPENAVVRLAHPIHMEPKEVDAWAEVLADYEILQPFDQLARPVMAFTEDELATGHLTRFEDKQVEVGRLLGLTKRGWRRAAPEDGGVEPGIHYPLPSGGYVTIALSPGIWVGMIAENPVQKLESVHIGHSEVYWYDRSRETQRMPEGIDPLTASEILVALERLTAGS